MVVDGTQIEAYGLLKGTAWKDTILYCMNDEQIIL